MNAIDNKKKIMKPKKEYYYLVTKNNNLRGNLIVCTEVNRHLRPSFIKSMLRILIVKEKKNFIPRLIVGQLTYDHTDQ